MRTLFIHLFIISYLSGYSQTDSLPALKNRNKKITYEACVLYFYGLDMNTVSGTSFTTAAIIKMSGHSLLLGPVWWLNSFKDANKFRGVLCSYRYSPDKTMRLIHFYFIGDLIYSYEKYEWAKYLKYDANNYYNIEYKEKWQSLQILGGYGVDIKLYKGFYVSNSMSVGIEFYNYRSHTNVIDVPALSSSYVTGNIFTDSRKSTLMKVGIGYRF